MSTAVATAPSKRFQSTITDDPIAYDDAALVNGLKNGDSHCAEALATSLYPRMYAACWRILLDEHDARDAVQDAFVSALSHIDQFRASARLSTWMLRISVNAALMMRRARKREPGVMINSLLPTFADDGHRVVERSEALDELVEHEDGDERRRIVRECVNRLPETHRSILILRDVDGLSTAETASVLGIRQSAAKVRLHRARMALRQLLIEATPLA